MSVVVCIEPGRLDTVDRPPREPAPGFVPIEIKAIRICGTDFHIFQSRHPFIDYPAEWDMNCRALSRKAQPVSVFRPAPPL